MPKLPPDEIEAWCSGRWDEHPPLSISCAGIDSRAVRSGMLFFALQGAHVDGHDFVGEALRGGAAAAVVRNEYRAPQGDTGCLLRVHDPARALRDIAREYRKRVGAVVTAVTGSAGKTTVKEMTASILSQRYRTAQTLGNWNNNIGLPLSLLAMDERTETIVLEMGTNHMGEIGDLCKIALPNTGIVTNIGVSHIENFKSVEAIAEEKGALLAALPREGMAVLDRDGDMFDRLCARAQCRVVTLSEVDGDYVLLGRDQVSRTARIREARSGDVVEFTPRLPGQFEVKDAMFAIAVARGLEMNWVDIIDGLNTYSPQPMRWQTKKLRGADFINDAYNANPVSMRATIEAFAELSCKGRKWLVLGGMSELGDYERVEHLALGRTLAQHDWHRLVVVDKLGWLIAEGAVEGGLPEERIHRCRDNDAAMKLLFADISAGDTVLLKASRRQRLEDVQSAFERH